MGGRRYVRAPVKAPVEFTPWDPRCIIFGFATDISLGGAFVETDFPVAPGRDVVLRVWPPGWEDEAILPAVVRWTRARGMGVQFSSVGGRETRAIRALVDDWRARSPGALQVGHDTEMVRRG